MADKPRRAYYTPEQRAEAVEMARTRGAAYAAAECGIKRATISQWARRAGVSLSRERRDDLEDRTAIAAMEWELRRRGLADQAGQTAERALRVVDDLLRPDAPVKDRLRKAGDAARVFATLVDKAQLLSGGATSRTEDSTTVKGRALEVLDRLEEQSKGPSGP